VGAPDLVVVCHGPSKVDRLAEQQSISKTSWAAASGGAELIDSLGGWDDYYPTVQTARGRHRDSATTRLVPLRAERPQPESAAPTTKLRWSYCRATTAGEGGAELVDSLGGWGDYYPTVQTARGRQRDSATARLVPLRAERTQPESAAATTKSRWSYYRATMAGEGHGKSEARCCKKKQQRTLVLSSSVI
jgi:hypothetical protein